MLRTLVLALACAACNGMHGDPGHIDGPGSGIPATIRVRGSAFDRSAGSSPVAGTAVRALGASQQLLAMTTTDAAGAYSLDIATGGMPVAVTLEAEAPSFVPTHRTFQYAFTSDHDGVWLDLMTPAEYAAVYATSGVARVTGRALVEIETADAYGTPVSGAQITTLDPSVHVMYGSDPSATMTGSSGLAYVLDAPADRIDLMATGGFFESDYITQGFADQLTVFEMDAGFGGD